MTALEFRFLPKIIGDTLNYYVPEGIMAFIVSYIIDIPLILQKSRIVKTERYLRENAILVLSGRPFEDERVVLCNELIMCIHCDQNHNCYTKFNCFEFCIKEKTFWNLSIIKWMYDVFYSPQNDESLRDYVCLAEIKLALLESISDIPEKNKMVEELNKGLALKVLENYRNLQFFEDKYKWGYFGTPTAILIQEHINEDDHFMYIWAKYHNPFMTESNYFSLWERRIYNRDNRVLYFASSPTSTPVGEFTLAAHKELHDAAFGYRPKLRL